jgi:hypothetical protein
MDVSSEPVRPSTAALVNEYSFARSTGDGGLGACASGGSGGGGDGGGGFGGLKSAVSFGRLGGCDGDSNGDGSDASEYGDSVRMAERMRLEIRAPVAALRPMAGTVRAGASNGIGHNVLKTAHRHAGGTGRAPMASTVQTAQAQGLGASSSAANTNTPLTPPDSPNISRLLQESMRVSECVGRGGGWAAAGASDAWAASRVHMPTHARTPL